MDTFGCWFPVSSDTLTSHRCIFVIKLTVYHIQYSICFYIFILVQHHIKNMQKCDTKLCLRSCVTHTLFLFLHSPHFCLHCFCSFRFFGQNIAHMKINSKQKREYKMQCCGNGTHTHNTWLNAPLLAPSQSFDA